MTERERLIELIRKFDIMSIPTDGFIEDFADYLIGNGIVVLPKVPQESHAEGCCIGKIGEWQGNPKYINQKQCYNSELDIRPIRYNDGESILTLPVKIGDTVYNGKDLTEALLFARDQLINIQGSTPHDEVTQMNCNVVAGGVTAQSIEEFINTPQGKDFLRACRDHCDGKIILW